jgi:uncharacterized membrane protein
MITNTPWTFVVVFMAILVVLVVFAVVWLTSDPGSAGEHRPSDPSGQTILARGVPRGEVSPDEYDEMPGELDGGYASSSGARLAEPVHS